MPFLLAGLASVSFGVADFLGGLGTRHSPAVSIVVTSQVVGGSAIAVAAIAVPGTADVASLAWGAAAGAAGGVGLVLLYHGLATTRMSVTAPVTAFFGTASPVVFGLVIGERPGAVAAAGIVLGLVGVVAIARAPNREDDVLRGGGWSMLLGVAAGLAFGLFGILISRTGSESGLWPLVGARGASILLIALVAAATRRPLMAPAGRSLAFGAGVLDMAANVMFLVAVRRELLSLVAVIMALYPVSTVALARMVLGERIASGQLVGLLIAGAAIVLIAMG